MATVVHMTNIYFASDFHFGAPNIAASRDREKKVIQWLDSIKHDAKHIFLVGDIFDFWFEYKHVIPKGHLHFISKIIELQNLGVGFDFFIGNHDMWMFDYFTKELGIPVHRNPIERTFGNKKFYIGHGDGLGPGDYGYKRLKKVFSNATCQWLFKWIHPDIGIGIADFWSKTSRSHTSGEEKYLGKDQEWLQVYCETKLTEEYFDYFVFGHRHLPIDQILSNQISKYINLGDWIQYDTYAVFNGEELQLLKYHYSC